MNEKALAALDENDSENDSAKAEFLRAQMKKGATLHSQNFSAAQATMFGGKVIRGALAEMLFGDEYRARDKNLFPVERTADVARLRERWFPMIDRNKRALRMADKKPAGWVVEAGGKKKKFNGVLAMPDDCPRPHFISPRDGKIIAAPEIGDEGVYPLQLRDTRELTILPADTRKKKPGKWEGVAGKRGDINLRAEKVRGLLVAVDGKKPFDDNLPFEWKREDDALKILAQNPGRHELIFAPRLSLAVVPPQKAAVRKYHHAIDAIVAATPVDWNCIARMTRDAKKRNRKAADIFEAEIEKARPLAADGKSPFPDSAPEYDGKWLVKSKQDKSGPKRAKTRREPLGLWKNPDDPQAKKILVQRKPLNRLPRKNVENITDAAGIREAPQKAWADIYPSEESRKKFVETTGSGENRKEYISHRWFLQLPKTHILHPHRTRSAPVKVGANPSRSFIVTRKGNDGNPVSHYFDREEPWAEVAVWEMSNGKRKFSHRRPGFYVNKDNPEEWENDKAPPSESKIVLRVRRGMRVRIDGEKGVWRVNALEASGATMSAHDEVAHAVLRAEGKSEKKRSYIKLRPA